MKQNLNEIVVKEEKPETKPLNGNGSGEKDKQVNENEGKKQSING